MNNFVSHLLLIILPIFNIGGMISNSQPKGPVMQTKESPVYKVAKLKKPLTIDGNWNKSQWKKVDPIRIQHYMGTVSPFQPEVTAKMAYDASNVYVIFQVKDRFVKSVVTAYNGPVSTDSCVEFFFSPDANAPLNYFNLEINAGGTPLMFYIVKNLTSSRTEVTPDDLKQIEIAHSLPSVVDPEITEPVTWTIEYRLPLSVLQKYGKVSDPAPGVAWKANFYKTGSKTSNPNYLTWSFVDNPRPNFHLPQFFGTVVFEK